MGDTLNEVTLLRLPGNSPAGLAENAAKCDRQQEMASWIKELVKFVMQHFGKDLVILAGDALRAQWRRIFASRNILVLGAKQSGKTTLLCFMQHGTPFEVTRDGERRTPDPTAAVAIVDKKVDFNKGNWLKLSKDVPGDVALRETWGIVLREVKPHGIIYMINGSAEDKVLTRCLDELFDDALSVYKDGLRELLAVHIFVGFSDQWAQSEPQKRKKLSFIADSFEKRREGMPSLETLRFRTAATQLSPNRKEWSETERALRHFGADLEE